MIYITYKYNMRQSPATKSLEHFEQRIFDRIHQIEKGLLELQISPLFKFNKNEFRWLLFLDVETITKIREPNKGLTLKTFTGKGLHVFNFVAYKIRDIIKTRQMLKQNECIKNKIDIATTLRVTPMRFLGCFSTKHKIWLHPYLVEHGDYEQIKYLASKPPSVYLQTKFAKQVCDYLSIPCNKHDLDTYARIIVEPFKKIIKSESNILDIVNHTLNCVQ
jgi:hypothetical protein